MCQTAYRSLKARVGIQISPWPPHICWDWFPQTNRTRRKRYKISDRERKCHGRHWGEARVGTPPGNGSREARYVLALLQEVLASELMVINANATSSSSSQVALSGTVSNHLSVSRRRTPRKPWGSRARATIARSPCRQNPASSTLPDSGRPNSYTWSTRACHAPHRRQRNIGGIRVRRRGDYK
jgi:hypothetical protein